MYDVAIIGCGVISSSIAYRLSRFNLKTVVLERENDVAMGATRANSAIIHAGYDPAEGTLMAKLNVRSVELTKDLCKKLDVPYAQIGSLVLAFSDEESEHVQKLYARGVANGVPGLRVLSYDETKAMEPNIADNVTCALYAPTAAVINPWEYALALAETAVMNGVELRLESEVESIVRTDSGFLITAGGKTIETKYVINAAGTEAGIVHDMVLPHTFEIKPNKGEYYLLDKSEGTRANHVVFQCPSKVGKGVLVSPTVHGNLIVGPNAVDCAAGDTSTSSDDLAFVRTMAVKSVPSIDFRQNIRNFAGVRPNSTIDDFIIEAHDGFYDVAGIKSPGLASAAGIAEYVQQMMADTGVALSEKDSYVDTRTQPRFKEMTHEERTEIVKKDPKFGRVICRCETITEGEIIDSIRRPIVPRTVDAIKRRCCAGMGRCQGGFCGPRVVEILSRELGVSRQDIDKDKTGSYIVRERED